MGASHKFDEHQCLDLLNQAKWENKMNNTLDRAKVNQLSKDLIWLSGFVSSLMFFGENAMAHALENMDEVITSISRQVSELTNNVD
jgi:hypothetical protein